MLTQRKLRGAARPVILALAAWAIALGALAGPADTRLVSGAQQGRVKARMTLDASGEVTRVEILDSNPRRVFDRAVVRSLSQWKYAPGADARSVEVEVEFRL